MTQNQTIHAPAWVMFTYVTFGLALLGMAVGIWVAPVDLWLRAFLFMGMMMVVQSAITMTKTQRDVHENGRMVNRIEDARTEKLLMDVTR